MNIKRYKTYIKKHADTKKLLLLLALISVFMLVYSPHFRHSYPIHLDEWTHISNAVRIREQGISYFFHHSPNQVGFDLILVFISFFADLIVIHNFLPAINAVVIAVVLFYFLKKEFNYWVGLFSVVFLASLRSNVNVLGLWFYVPVIGAIVFDYACLFFLERGVRENNQRDIYLVVLFLFLIAFVHTSSFLVIFSVVIIYLCFNYKFALKHKKYFAPFLVLIIPSFMMFLFLSKGLINVPAFFRAFVWGPAVTHIGYNPFLFYGILPSLFAIPGYYFCCKQKKLLAFRIYVLLPLINLFMFPYTNFTLFSAYQRYIYHFMIACIPLSAVGFYYVLNHTKTFLKRYNKILAYAAVILMVAGSIFVIFSGYRAPHPRAQIYYSIQPAEYNALQSLREYPPGNILTLIRIGSAIKAVTGHEDVFDFYDGGRRGQLNEFYGGDCSLKKEFLYNHYFISDDINYIHSKSPINCSFLEVIYARQGNYIYEVNLERDKLLSIDRTVSFEGWNEIKIYNSEKFRIYNFTFYAWIKPEDKTGVLIKSPGYWLEDGWTFRIDHDDHKNLVVIAGDLKIKYELYGEKNLSKNQWNFVALTYDGNFSIYLNGELDKSIKADLKYDEKSLSPMQIGSDSYSYYHGEMKGITLDNYSYSPNKIKILYLKGKNLLDINRNI